MRKLPHIAGIVLAITLGIFVNMPLKAAPTEQELRDYAFGVAINRGISPHFLISVIETESMFSLSATNGNLMQIIPQFQKERMERLGITDIYDPYQNIALGAAFLEDLFIEYEDPSVVLIVYNEGLKSANKAQDGYLSYYAQKTLERAYELEQIYERGGDDDHG